LATPSVAVPLSAGAPAPTPVPVPSSALADLAILTVAAVAARLAFGWILPPEAFSYDLRTWPRVAGLLREGLHLYISSDIMAWPPFWMQFVYLFDHLAALLGVPLFRVIQAFLTSVEIATMTILYGALVNRFALPRTAVRRTLLVGIALNPMIIMLNCQHGNFDSIVGLWVLLAVLMVCRFMQYGERADWLLACMMLGLGILTKTTPLVLVPLLFFGFRRLLLIDKICGALLVFGPVVLAVSVLYVVWPTQIATNVLGYRSSPGWFGITGLLQLAGASRLYAIYPKIYPALMLVALAATSVWALHIRRASRPKVVLLAAMLLAAVPALGPGYASQYIEWFYPLWVMVYAFSDRPGRRLLFACFAIAATTYAMEYAFIPSHGGFLRFFFDARWIVRWSGALSSQSVGTLFRLPLFACYLAALGFGACRLSQSVPDLTG